MFPFVAYHGVTTSVHQSRVDELASRGFRPISLSVSGAPGDAKYAAVWQQRPGPAWVAVYGLSATQYQSRFNELTGEGFAPGLVSATGTSDAVFAAVFEADLTLAWFARPGLRRDPAGPVSAGNASHHTA